MITTTSIDVDIKNNFPAITTIRTHELNVATHMLRINLYDNGAPFNIDDDSTFDIVMVTDGKLIKEFTTSYFNDNSISFNIANIENENNFLVPGKMVIQVSIISGSRNFTLPIPIIVYVSDNIINNAKVTPESLGTVSEIMKEVAAARGEYEKLPQRLDEIDEFLKELDVNKESFGDYSNAITSNIADLDNFNDNSKIYKISVAGALYGGSETLIGLMINAGTMQFLFGNNGNLYIRTDNIFKPLTDDVVETLENKLDDYVKSTDYGTSQKGGTVKSDGGYGFSIDSNGVACCTSGKYENKSTGLYYFASFDTIKNLLANEMSADNITDIKVPTMYLFNTQLLNKVSTVNGLSPDENGNVNTPQYRLTAGNGISIDENNVISLNLPIYSGGVVE